MTEVEIPNDDLEETARLVEELCEAHDSGRIAVRGSMSSQQIRLEYGPTVEYNEQERQIIVKRRSGGSMATIKPDSTLKAVDMEDAESIING